MQTIEKTIQDKKIRKITFLKQSLMEFNNALSHLFNALIHKQSESNLLRAKIHIQRATLDFYKAIIKDLSFLKKIDNEVDFIKQIRLKEYSKIGSEPIDINDIILIYHKQISKLLFKSTN